MSSDFLNAGEVISHLMTAPGTFGETRKVEGHYDLVCTDSDGNILWTDGFDNLVTTAGQVQLLVSGVVGSAPAYMGLMAGATGASTPDPADTMASHAGWVEANASHAPSYGTTRPTMVYGAAAGVSASGQISNNASPCSFVFTASGSINGGFVAFGPGATNANSPGTVGVLLSAGTLAPAQPVISGNTITMTYTLTL